MHSYLQRHIRTHGCSISLPSLGGGSKDGVAVKASVGGVTTTTTLFNPITLETSGNSGSLIVSQPALNIPPNTSQNYFMIQTTNGLQLIPLSSPAPAPPPPPPPAQSQNFLLFQCLSNNGNQSKLILLPAANNSPAAPDLQPLPVLQTIQAFQPVLNQTQTQIAPFPAVSQQQQQAKIVIANTPHAPVAKPTHSIPPNSLLTRPILGRSTRTARGRRGRKPKAALQKSSSATVSQAGGDRAVPVTNGNAADASSLGSPSTDSQHPNVSTPEGGDRKSLMLQINNGSQDKEEKEEDLNRMVSLLHEWDGRKEGGGQEERKGSQSKSYVFHFHSEAQDGAPSTLSFNQGQDNSMELSCTPTQAFIPLDGQEVVFDLGGGAKMEQEAEEGMQMIALIEGEGEMMGEEGARCNPASDVVSEDVEDMESIFQLQNGDEIVIIEVSTSGLREGRMEGGTEGEMSPRSDEKYESTTGDTKENSVKEHNSVNGTEVQLSTEATRKTDYV